MAQGKDIIPIPSNKSRRHLEENLQAVDIKLTQEDLARLEYTLCSPVPPPARALAIWNG